MWKSDETLDIGMEHNAPLNLTGYNMGRLEGGSAIKDEDEIKDLLYATDEEEPPKQPPKKEATVKTTENIPPPIVPQKSKKSKLSRILFYTKTVVFIFVLLLAIILLAMTPDVKLTKQQFSLQPNTLKTLPVSNMNDNEKQLGVKITGPFTLSDICPKKNDGTNSPTVEVSVTESEDKRVIGKSKTLCLVEPKKLDDTPDIEKDHLFNLKDRKKGSKINLNFLSSGTSDNVYILVETNAAPIDTKRGIIYGLIVLFFLYFMIVTEIIDRTFASLIAAAIALGVLAVCNGKATQNQLIEWVDIETLTLLVGMMLLVSILAESGLFDYFAVFAYKIAKGRVWPLVNCLSFFTAFLAMFLDSVTMMLLATPVTIRLCEVLSLDPVPILICMVLFANVGAATTPVGDPPNVIISLNQDIVKSGVNFANFCLHMLPGVVLALIQTYIHIRLLFRKPESLRYKDSKQLKDLRQEIGIWKRTAAGISPTSQDEDVARDAIAEKIRRLEEKLADMEKNGSPENVPSFETTLAHLTEQYPLRDKPLLIKASVAFVFVIILFCTHSVPNFLKLSLGWSALLGALLLLVISDKRDLEAILVRIEWSTLLFFASLFIIMESLSLLGVIDLIGTFVVHVISSVQAKYQLALAICLVVWVSGIASAFLDNIPVATMMLKIVIRLAADNDLNLPLHPLVWSLAFGACFGGNGTLIGASANLVTAGVSEQHGYKISFVRFFVVCFPVMLGNLFVATIYLLIAHVAFPWHHENDPTVK